MTESEWLGCEDPRKLLEWLRGLVSDRKLRLFACAYWHWHYRNSSRPEAKTEAETIRACGERWAEYGDLSRKHRRRLFDICGGWHPLVACKAIRAASWTIRQTAFFEARDGTPASAHQVWLLRELFGDPFRTATVEPALLRWHDGAVVKIAQAIDDERAFERLPILGDALEDAGCTKADILEHCRRPGEHIRGCWVLDLTLRKK